MPGDRKHHTDKWRRCVDEVMGKGHDESSASAICTTSLQNAGEEIFEVAEHRALEGSSLESLHLLGSTGQVRYEMLNGRRHLVVPIVALMEGVIHPVNAETPEFVPAEVLRKAASSWVGKPVTIGHPRKGNTQCSAVDPEIRKASGIGVIMKSEFDKKLLQEAWIDEEKVKRLHPNMYARLVLGSREEVSVGAFVVTSAQSGDYNGKPYKAMWLETQGDHLAFLPGGRGACSCEMGCGTHRAAMHLVTAEAITLLPERLPALVFSALDGEPLEQRINLVYSAVSERWPPPLPVESTQAYVGEVFDDYVIVTIRDETFSVPYEMKDGKAVLGEPKKVKRAWVDATATTQCDECEGTGQVKKDGKQEDCPACHGTGEMRAASIRVLVGSRHSKSDMEMIQGVHDHAVALGAECDRSNYKMMGAGSGSAVPVQRIRHEGGKWVLYTEDGTRQLGSHATEGEARSQMQAIETVLRRRSLSLGGDKTAVAAAGCSCKH